MDGIARCYFWFSTYSRWFFAYSSNDSDVGKHGVFPTRKLFFCPVSPPQKFRSFYSGPTLRNFERKLLRSLRWKAPSKNCIRCSTFCHLLIMQEIGLHFQILDPLSKIDNENLIASWRNLFITLIDLMSINFLTYLH